MDNEKNSKLSQKQMKDGKLGDRFFCLFSNHTEKKVFQEAISNNILVSADAQEPM